MSVDLSADRVVVNCLNFDVDNLSLVNIEHGYKLLYNGKLFTLEISPKTKKLSDGLFCYGVKQYTDTLTHLIGINLVNHLRKNESHQIWSCLTNIEQKVSDLVKTSVQPLLRTNNKSGDAILNVKCTSNSRFKLKRHVMEGFPVGGFRGVYYIDFNNVFELNDKWYISNVLNTVVISERTELGDEFSD